MLQTASARMPTDVLVCLCVLFDATISMAFVAGQVGWWAGAWGPRRLRYVWRALHWLQTVPAYSAALVETAPAFWYLSCRARDLAACSCFLCMYL